MVRNIIPFDRGDAGNGVASDDHEAAADVVAHMLRAETAENASPLPAESKAYAEMESIWDALGMLDAEDFADARTPSWSRRHVMAGIGAIAATLVVGVTSYTLMPQTYESKLGEQKVIALTDGSHVTLNTQSRIEVSLVGQRRIVLRRGEALFEVARKPDRAPFYVVSDQANIRVTGTKFNVRRFDDHTGIDLLEGHIRVSRDGSPNHAVTLSAGQAIDVGHDGRIGALKIADAAMVADWTHNRLTFTDDRLIDAIARMNRYSAIQLQVKSPALKNIRVNGVFEAGDATGFAEALHGLYGVDINRHASVIILSPGIYHPATL
jgi:transmembrane sensor